MERFHMMDFTFQIGICVWSVSMEVASPAKALGSYIFTRSMDIKLWIFYIRGERVTSHASLQINDLQTEVRVATGQIYY